LAYKTCYKSSVEKDLKKIDKQQVKRIFDKIESDLSVNPGKDKKLTGEYKGLFSYTVGDYRIIYSLISDKETILILRISHRKDVYNK